LPVADWRIDALTPARQRAIVNALSQTSGLQMSPFRALLWCVCGLLMGCAAPLGFAPSRAQWQALLDDSAFATPAAPAPDAATLFTLSPPMRRYLQEHLAIERARGVEAVPALVRALYERGQLRLEYESHFTRTAAQAFADARGNCLSLVAMTAAFADALGLRVQFFEVPVSDAWEFRGGVLVDQGHVNLALSPSALHQAAGGSTATQISTVVDFLPEQDLARQQRLPITRERVMAMYLNNRAVEHLQQGDIDTAYAWLRAALQQDPGFATAYNTLSVLYLRKQRAAQALASLDQALALAPQHEPALSNRIQALEWLGRFAQASLARQQLENWAQRNSRHHFERGREALAAQQWKAAQTALARALKLAPENPDIHFALASALAGLQDATGTAQHLALAARFSGSAVQQQRYTAKLEKLRLAHPSLATTGG
jgi:tetratricopeptide (TPR) repeat protein